ncbi:MAG: bifunctional 5,10-methylenetetrahydrofolate dehydrogenase/5,10-methenyltetrahydrofolate cyclohydrolase [Candidatus Nomurabacteria bacterium]|jgi:methylenetetrahydrofolate dehydrogenase (NADP+)/methenyltetrahydrofolate cyclohydrolase|nr:bifunctional 5,10-methylenetetrahydrofolate dehydrogenase/5,10-methenyltetrahydrofolate cyclohydrolase [Candidatus Nomurabacteria bacterium]
MKILSGRDLAEFVKERQTGQIAKLERAPKLLILKDSENPVIVKYVELKQKYGRDIGAEVEIRTVMTSEMENAVLAANSDGTIDGMIVQLPLVETGLTERILASISPKKDVDGLLGAKSDFDSATAEAILWLLTGYNIELAGRKIAVVGRGKLVGEPLTRIFASMGLDFRVFTAGDSLRLGEELVDFDIVISATGVAGLILPEFLKRGAIVVDAGTASEGGVLKGDLSDETRLREDLTLTPRVGGVGPLTICVLFEHLISVATRDILK